MKTTKMLPLAVIMSGVLAGCGGDSSSGGGSPTIITQTDYTYTFLKAEDIDADSVGSCTVFTRDTEAGTIKTYKSINDNLDGGDSSYRLVAFYSNSDGSRSGDLITPTDGVISFIYESIPDDGFITFEERNGTTLLVTSLSKTFLARDPSWVSAEFGVQSSGVGDSCVTENNYSIEELTLLSYSSSESGGDGSYTFISQLDSEAGTNSILQANSGDLSLESFVSESTMIKEMNGDEVHQYAFDDWEASNGYIPMVYADASDSVSNNSNIDFTDIDVNLLYNNFVYDLVEYDSSITSYSHPSTTNGETWLFSVSGDTQTEGWEAEYYGQLDESWSFNINDSELYSLTSLVNDEPTIVTSDSTTTIDLSDGGISFNGESGIQRVSYKSSVTESSQPYVVTHNIYTVLSETVVVPEIEYFNFSSTVQDGLLVSDSATFAQYFLVENEDSSTIENVDFMSIFSHGNGIDLDTEVNGIVINEMEANESSVRLQSSEHVRLYR